MLFQPPAEYVKGAAESLVGDVTGSKDWKEAGEEIKQDATEAIRNAAQTTEKADDSTATGKAQTLAEKACPAVGGGVGQTKE